MKSNINLFMLCFVLFYTQFGIVTNAQSNGDLRLTEGNSGQLEVYFNGWGFICDDSWSIVEANTTCKILGYGTAVTTTTGRYNASTNYKLNLIDCIGNETSILDCGYRTYVAGYCSSYEHIYIECGYVNGNVRLNGGDSGLLEVYYNGWGFICDDGWGTVDANTVCQILGYGAALSTSTSRYNSSTNYKLNYINCGGNEASILECGYSLYTSGYCSSFEHIYISCGPANGEIRLTEGFSGLLEVYYNGWGFICDDGWGNIDANTSCRILGYEGAITTSIARYNSSTNYKLNYIACTGSESSILDCGYSLYTPYYCSSSEHIFIECGPVNGDLRLTGGDSGLVEVYYNGWGFICDDGWGSVDSTTVCIALGYGSASSTTTSVYHSSTNYKLRSINCQGTETNILDCGYTIYAPNVCSRYEHVSISCGRANGEIRLTEGFSGLLEVYYNGWGFVCDDGWDVVDANTSCRILGYEGAITTSIARYNSSTNYKLNYIACTGNESSILDCGYSLYTPYYCSSSEHIYIECGPVNGDLRLAGGDSGLVEVYYNGWGYICDDAWGTSDSNAACRILGYGSSLSTTTSSYHVSTNYKLNYINCGGSEASILDCGYSLYTPGFCSRYEHVYITCGPANGEIRLTGGFSGLLEVYYNGWGFVCDSGWDDVDANTTCKILGYESVITTSVGHYNSSSSYKLTSIACSGTESQFLDCGYSTSYYSLYFCSASDHVFVECGPVNGDLRLAGGDSGLVEVYYNGWGYICDDGWGSVDSTTICQILGYGAALSTTTRSYHVSTNYRLNFISCTGNESSILDCGYREYTPNYCSQNEHVYVTCGPANGEIRLTEGFMGLLEVYYNGWGFICDDGWGSIDANTTCQILGYESSITTSIRRYNASTNYKLNFIDCSGSETSILDCSYQIYTPNYCSAYEHIYIECGPVNGDLRLTGGDNGLLEVYYNGWGFICDDRWDTVDANTVCILLGHDSVNSTQISRYHSSTDYKLNLIDCTGNETSILDCGYREYQPNYCSQSEHIYLSCSPAHGELRLTGGFSGLLEVYYNGWGFICDDGWDSTDANTTCRILGYESVIATSIGQYNSSTNYKLNNIECQGSETSILDCNYRIYSLYTCSGSEHIYIECGPVNGDLRLAGGDSGLVEVYYNGWGYICDDGWGSVDSTTICQILGYGAALSTTTSSYHVSTNYKLNYISCTGNESSILDCGYREYTPNYCSQNEHVYVTCGPANGEIRLTGGFNGLLEIYYNGWGFICDDGWDTVDANTTCQILGYERAITTSIGRYNASTNYKINYIECLGNETNILDCSYRLYSLYYCSSREHIYLECGPINGDLRLAGGDTGLVEVYYNGWGYICDDGWGTVDSNTVCQILGYGAAVSTNIRSYHVSTNYRLNYIGCTGNETSILDCGYRVYRPNYCSQYEHVNITCGPGNGAIRLTGGHIGLLEVYYNGWGFICDDGWDNIDANTTCKILGYETAIATSIRGYNASTNYKLNYIDCSGSETNILDCSYQIYTPNYCSAYEHIYIECGPVNGELRLTGGDYGLLEVYYNGWGFICDDGWDNVDANTVCTLLGHDSVNSTQIRRYHSSTDYKLNFINCVGGETSILDCGYREYQPNYCSQSEHIYLSCSPSPPNITTLSFEFKGTYSSPSPYVFTCGINSAPHTTLTLIIEGITYTQTETNSISQTLDLIELSPGTYQFICLANNSNGGDSKVGEFTIKEPIPSPFSQFAYLPKAGRPCNTFDITNCVDLIFIVDISASINTELNRIAELAGNLPENSGACNNRYGFVIFGVQNYSKILNLTSNSLYGTPTQLKSVILNSRGLDNTIGYGPEDAYPAIHDAVTTYEFRDGVQRKIVLFADEMRQSDSSTLKYTYENTLSLLLSNDITLSVVSYLGTIRYHNQASQNRLIGMKFFNNIGFGNFSSIINDSDLTVVSTPYFLASSANIYYSYVFLAWDTKGSAFDMTYFHQSNTPYFPHLIARLFEFAVIQDVPCQFTDLSFNFDRRYVSTPYLYSRWTDIKPQMQSECVDMVFLVDRTGSMSSNIAAITNLAQYLPDNSTNCNNRYGLVSFESTANIFNIGGGNAKFGTADQLYTELSSFSLSGATEDGYVGIDAILREYNFRMDADIRKHIILFTDEPRSIVNSSLTKSSLLPRLGENGFILSVVTDADYFYRVGSTITRMVATAVVSESYVGFRTTGSVQQFIDSYSPVTVSTRSSNQHNSYAELAWKTGGLAFDLAYFTSSTSNQLRTVRLFQSLMYSWGTYVPLKISSTNSEVKGGNIEVSCTTNNVPNVSISLIAGGQRFSEDNAVSIKANLSLSTIDTESLAYVCLANNSIGGDSAVNSLNIQIEHGPPVNATLTVQSSTSIHVEWSPPISSLASLFTYTVFYSGDPFDTSMKSVTTGPSTTRVLLINLTPYTLYSVYITAVTHFDSNQTEILTAKTLQQAPTAGPEEAIAIALNSTSLLIQWSPPSPIHQNGPIRSYTLSYPTDGLSDAGTVLMQITVSVVGDAEYPLTARSEYILKDLNPYNLYNVTIVARNDEGRSPQTSVTERTLGIAPSQSPRNVTVETESSTAIQVSWDPPPISGQNGIITGYRIYFRGVTFDTERSIVEFTIQTPVYPAHDRNSMLLPQLEEHNQYNIAVVAVNINGTSASSDEVAADTLPASPSSPPESIRITTVSSTSVNISWYPPTAINQNGIINGYTILYQKASGDDAVMTVEIDSDSKDYPQSELHYYVLRHLEKETNYSIEIKAKNTAGLGVASLPQYHYTKELVPGLVRALTVVSKTSSTITVSWNPPLLLYPDSTISTFTLEYGENIDSLQSMTVLVDERESYQHTFSNLKSQTPYLIRVYASNVFGNGENVDLEVVTNPQDSVPQITDPDSNKTLTEDLSLNYNRTISCTASGYPPPTIRWYNSENEAVTDGPILFITVRNVTNGIVFVCKAENRAGFVSRSIQIVIRVVDPDSTLDDLEDEIDVAGFNPEEAGEVADTIRLALPKTDNVLPEDTNKTRDTLDKAAGVNEVLLDKITDNNTDIPLDDAERIVNTAGEIAVKDTELDAGVDTPILSPEALNRGIISFASDALLITLRTIEKVCRNLGNNHLKNDSTQETVIINSTYVKVYGVNLPIKEQPEELSLPINEEIAIGESVKVSKDTMVGLADGQINVKIFVATLNLDSALLIRKGSGTKHASNIVIVVIPKILTNVSLSKDATISLPTRARRSSIQSGTYLRGNAWAASGIITNVISENMTELETNHFTSFALFGTPTAVVDWDFYLSIISYVLSFTSIVFLILSLLLFIFSSRKGFFKVEINILYFNLALALLFANGIFALYGIRANVFPDLFCKILAGIIHYSWITVFTWCLLFGIYIFYKLSCGINKERIVYPYLIIIAWTVPLIFPVITVALKLDEYIDNTEHCFPSIKQIVVVGLVGPVLVLSIVTILLAVVFSFRFISVKKRIESEKQRAHIKHILVSTGVFSCFLIVPWIFLIVYALLGYFEVAFQWIFMIEWVFVLLNDLMGIVFFFVIAIRNRQVILLITRKQDDDETEIIQRAIPRRDVIDNPTYGGVTNFGAENLAFCDSIEKNPGAEYSIYAEIGDFKCEKSIMEKKGIVSYNPYATSDNMACDALPTPFDNELPPVYDQVTRVTSTTFGFNNPVYGMGGEEAPQEVYQDMHFADNPCLEELKPEEEPYSINSTGTRIEKENDYDV